MQREANNRFGLSAQAHAADRAGALRAAQDDHLSAHRFARAAGRLHPDRARNARQPRRRSRRSTAQKVLDEGWVRPNKRIFNNAQISDHFAIIPTGAEPKNLDEMEAEDLRHDRAALRRGVFSRGGIRCHDAHQHGRRRTRFQDRRQSADRAGWLAVYGKTTVDDSADAKALACPNERRTTPQAKTDFGRAARRNDQAAAALHRSDAALRDGRRGQTRRRRRAWPKR